MSDNNEVITIDGAKAVRKQRLSFDASAESIKLHKRKLALASGLTSKHSAVGDTAVEKDTGKTTEGKATADKDDPVAQLMSTGHLIEPPFDMLGLALLPENSSELYQCIEAMVINVVGFGHRFIPRVVLEKIKEEATKKEVLRERTLLENFFQYASIDDDWTIVREKLDKDIETTGNSYLEVIRGANGKIQGLEHVPSYQVSIGRQQKEMQPIDLPILELQEDGSVKVVKVKRWKRFRKYLQSRSVRRRNLSIVQESKGVWFKEFQDPRIIDNQTGEDCSKKPKEEIEKMAKDGRLANELIHFRLYSTRSVYGLPRYIGNLLAIYGDRAAEEINYVTFTNNNIPSMVVAVSNGQLTQGSVDRIESFVESNIQGGDNYSKFLILEAETFMEGEDGGQIKVDIKPLVRDQHKDAMFQKYSHANRDSIRRAFRLPPILVGRSEDYTRATAEASRKLADEQVFAPARNVFDSFVNRRLFPEMGIRYHKYKTNSPNTTDNSELVRILSGSEKTGGMTPRIARLLLSDILGMELPPFPEDFDADSPFSLTMAQAVKNEADPSEPGQQVTALKNLAVVKVLTGDNPTTEEIEDAKAEALAELQAVKSKLETAYRLSAFEDASEHTEDGAEPNAAE